MNGIFFGPQANFGLQEPGRTTTAQQDAIFGPPLIGPGAAGSSANTPVFSTPAPVFDFSSFFNFLMQLFTPRAVDNEPVTQTNPEPAGMEAAGAAGTSVEAPAADAEEASAEEVESAGNVLESSLAAEQETAAEEESAGNVVESNLAASEEAQAAPVNAETIAALKGDKEDLKKFDEALDNFTITNYERRSDNPDIYSINFNGKDYSVDTKSKEDFIDQVVLPQLEGKEAKSKETSFRQGSGSSNRLMMAGGTEDTGGNNEDRDPTGGTDSFGGGSGSRSSGSGSGDSTTTSSSGGRSSSSVGKGSDAGDGAASGDNNAADDSPAGGSGGNMTA